MSAISSVNLRHNAYMTELLKFLNNNSGAFNLLFSAVVAVATVVYAVLTARLVRETERLRAAATEPALEVTYRSNDEAMSLLDIVIKNIGSGPAYDIRFEFTADTSSPGAEALLKPLRELKSFQSGLNVLLPGQEFSSFWTDIREQFDSKVKTVVSVSTTCKSANGDEYGRTHTIDLSELQGVARLGTPPLLAISRSLKKVQDDLHKLVNGSQRIRVDAFSQADRDAEQAEWEAFKRAHSAKKPENDIENTNGTAAS